MYTHIGKHIHVLAFEIRLAGIISKKVLYTLEQNLLLPHVFLFKVSIHLIMGIVFIPNVQQEKTKRKKEI